MLTVKDVKKSYNYKRAKEYLRRFNWTLVLSSKDHEDLYGYINYDLRRIVIYVPVHDSLDDFDTTLVHELAHFFTRKQSVRILSKNDSEKNLQKTEKIALKVWDKVIADLSLKVDLIKIAVARKIDYSVMVRDQYVSKKLERKLYAKEKRKILRGVLSGKIEGGRKKNSRIRKVYKKHRKISKKRNKQKRT